MKIDLSGVLLTARAVLGAALRDGITATNGGVLLQDVVNGITGVVEGKTSLTAGLLTTAQHAVTDLKEQGALSGSVVVGVAEDLLNATAAAKNAQSGQAVILAVDLNLFGVPGEDVYVPTNSDVYRFMHEGYTPTMMANQYNELDPSGKDEFKSRLSALGDTTLVPKPAAAANTPNDLAQAYFNLNNADRATFHNRFDELYNAREFPPTSAATSGAENQPLSEVKGPSETIQAQAAQQAKPPSSTTLPQPNPSPEGVVSPDPNKPPQGTPVT